MSDADAVRGSFADQAAAFEAPDGHFRNDAVLEWLGENSPVEPGDIVLEVAAGTAIFGRVLAPTATAVVALDITPEMLAQGHRATTADGLRNVVFQLGDARDLPFLDESFDRVLSRLAIHHFPDPAVPLQEMARVCRPGGTITIVDMVVLDHQPEEIFNNLEKLRDPAHTRALTRAQLRDVIISSGCDIVHTATYDNVLDGERWLAQTATPTTHAERIREAWEAELHGGPATGMHPRRCDRGIEFTHHWDLHVAMPRRATSPGTGSSRAVSSRPS